MALVFPPITKRSSSHILCEKQYLKNCNPSANATSLVFKFKKLTFMSMSNSFTVCSKSSTESKPIIFIDL